MTQNEITDHGYGFTSKVVPNTKPQLHDLYYGETRIRIGLKILEIQDAIRDFGDSMSRD